MERIERLQPRAGRMSPLTLRLLLFLSGAAALAYEVVWTRLLGDVLGSTALAMTGVLAVFLAALALGAGMFGRLEIHGARGLRLYGALELGIAVTAAGSSGVLLRAGEWSVALAPDPAGPLLPEVVFALGLSAAVLGPATLLMGGTLPVALGAARSSGDLRAEATRLYGWNTLGAAAGTLLAGFVLIWKLGIVGTLAVAVSANAVAGCLAVLLARTWDARPGSGRSADADPPDSWNADDDAHELERRLWPVLAFVGGFAVLGLEILWGRMGRFLLGDRTMAVSALLFIFVSALGVASLVAWPVVRGAGVRGVRGAARLAGVILMAAGVLHLVHVPVAAGIVTGQALPELLSEGLGLRLAVFTVLGFPPALLLGLLFPVLLLGAAELTRRPTWTLGRLYLINGAGAVAGAVVATFLLARWTGTVGGFLALSGLLVVTGAFTAVATSRTRAVRALAGVSLFSVVFALVAVPRSLAPVRPGEVLVESNEDEYGVQSLVRSADGTIRVRNNRVSLIYDLGDSQTERAQQMAAHWAVLLAGAADRVLNIGTGYGITAGAFTLYRHVLALETVELLPFLVDRQDDFADHNFAYWEHDWTLLVEGDGRRYLRTADREWNVISVNVLDPYLPGSSALYTVDFWQEARARLRPGGVFTQLVWGRDLGLLVKGMRQVFPTLLFFPEYSETAYTVVAFADTLSRQDVTLHLERLTGEARSEIARVLDGNPESSLARGVLAAWHLTREMEALADSTPGPVHTDDRPVLEYRWAHGVPGVSVFDSPLVRY